MKQFPNHLNVPSARLTCQHISHDGITQKWDVVDDVPEAFEVGEQVVDGVGWRLQGQFDPCEELSCQRPRREFSKLTEQITVVNVKYHMLLCSYLRVVQFCPWNPVRVQSHS